MNVIVLAGDRGPNDPLARQAGVPGKTLVPVAGRAMLTRVLDSLGAWPRAAELAVVAPASDAYEQAIEAANLSVPVTLVAPADSPSRSVGKALAALGDERPVMLVTADHPLLSPDWLEGLCGEGEDDLRVGLVDHAGVRARFPDSRRTRYRFADLELGGTNLFQFRSRRADAVLELWQRVERERKKPWKIVSLVGWSNLARYLAGRLRVDEAFEALSERLGFSIDYRLVPDPLSAVDVDTPEDLRLVEGLIDARCRASAEPASPCT
ncbi:nucleotidyltransferase family protein [Wenzhouxiangella marina]|uniref:MobA-like NTP transferase domain-containing protein n=1 Tax=Wenzhouxiangella marina TaxID=1579979 RepID=A0A0K0XWS9_9GAMM|nr:nucleotidyltransferase family protein [Wenzhouxiangella marina]AKS42087.1 hypothetical protein WM2015_1718 [Wenzhouxiangella marina]MBB6086143.1 GTP:adenosylcobinamide-phosphate guanylyltransferase [Wenzhouxiangella marina]